MKQEQLDRILHMVKSPAFMVSAAVIAGIFINIYVISVFVAPAFSSRVALDNNYRELLQQKEAADQRPMPAKASETEMERLIKQVPTQDDMPRFYMSLHEMEKESGAALMSIQLGDGDPNNNNLESLLTNKTGLSNNSQPNQTSGTAGASGTTVPNLNGTASSLEEVKLSVSVRGTYAQVGSFIRKLDQSERLVVVRNWNMHSGAVGQAATDAAIAGKPALSAGPSASVTTKDTDSTVTDKVTAELMLSVFTAKAYAGKFKQLPPIQPKEAERRSDPTWTEQQFMKMLETNREGTP